MQGAQRTLVDRPVPCLGRTRRLGVAGPGHRLPYARDAGLAPVSPGRATTGSSALEQALIARFGTFGAVPEPFRLRSDNGLVFTSRRYTALVKSYGLRQEFITPHCPQQNGMVERVTRTLKEQYVHRHRFESLQHSSRVIGDWIGFTTISARIRR